MEIRKVVAKLRNSRSVGATEINKAGHLKRWLRDIKREEAVDGKEGAGSGWRLSVSLIQAVWERGTVPTQMSWMVIVLLPKGGRDYCVLAYLTHVEGREEHYDSPTLSH